MENEIIDINETESRGVGAPLKIDVTDPAVLKQIELFGRLLATYEEMANWFGVTTRTIENYMADQEGQFFRVYKRAGAECKTSLRRVQLNKALSQQDTTLLIWLGKQLLGQKDKNEMSYSADTLKALKPEDAAILKRLGIDLDDDQS